MGDKLVQIEHLRQYFPAGGYGKKKNISRRWMMYPFILKRERRWGW